MAPKKKKLTSEQMMDAIRAGTVGMAERSVIRYGMPAPTIEINEHTLLRLAIQYKRSRLVELMIEWGCSLTGEERLVRPGTSYYGSLLHVAVTARSFDTLMLLLQNNAPRELTKYLNGWTPLLSAVHAKQKQIVLILLQYDANWNAVDPQGRTALHLAIGYPTSERENYQNIIEILEIFLSKGLEVDIKSREGETPLHSAIKHRKKELVEFLLLHGANINEHRKNGDTVLHILVRNEVEQNQNPTLEGDGFPTHRHTVQDVAPEEGRESKADFVDWLISKGADFTLQNNDGETPLQLAIALDEKYAMQVLLKYTLDANSYNTLFHTLVSITTFNSTRAIKFEDVAEAVRILIRGGFEVDSMNNAGKTSISIAASKNNHKMLKILLQHSANLNMTNEQNKVLLHTLLQENAFNDDFQINQTAELVEMLLEKGALVDCMNRVGKTPMDIALDNNQKKCLKVLLEHTPVLNMTIEKNKVFLHSLLYKNADINNLEMDEVVELVKLFLEKGAVVHFVNERGDTPISIAAKHNQKKILRILLPYTTNLLHRGDAGMINEENKLVLHTVLENSAKIDHSETEEAVELVKLILEKGASVNYVNRSWRTPISIAVGNNQKKFLKILLQHASSLNMIIEKNKLLLNSFLYKNANIDDSEMKETVELIELFLKKGAMVDWANKTGDTPISIAVKNNQKPILKTLLPYSCSLSSERNKQNLLIIHTFLKMNAKNDELEIKETAEIVNSLLEKKASVDSVNKNGEMPIHIAAKYGQIEILRILLPQVTNVNICDKNGKALLHILADTCIKAEGQHEADYVEIVNTLLLNGAKINLKNKDSLTPLQLSAKHKSKMLLELLLKHGADPHIIDAEGKSILHLLILSKLKLSRAKERELVELFTRYGCNVNARTKRRMTALHLAAQSRCASIAKALIDQGADMHCTDPKNLDTPLHIAAERNSKTVVRTLLASGADVDAKRMDGMTALHIATKHPHIGLVSLLLNYDADIEALDNNGKTPLHYACWYENADCIDFLILHGAEINAKDHFENRPEDYISKIRSEVLYNFLVHVVKHHVANLYMAGKHRNDIHSLENRDAISKVSARYIEEIEKLENTMVESPISINHILRASENELSACLKISVLTFDEIKHTEEFKAKYPLYGEVVIASYYRGVRRYNLMEAARKSLRHLSIISLPDCCTKIIFNYLNNNNLQDLIKADTNINIIKRKYNQTHDDSLPSTKQQKTG